MGSAGLDARTGRVLRDFDHVVQSVSELFNTRYASRVMRRWVFAGLPALLGRRITERRVGLYLQLVQLAIDTYEPRLSVVRVSVLTTSPDVVRLGELEFEIFVLYRPNGHRGDLTVEGGQRRLILAANDSTLMVRLAEVA